MRRSSGQGVRPSGSRRVGLVEGGLLVLILLVAAGFRLYRLDAIPPGLTHDEADTGYFVAAVYRGQPSQVEAPYGYANEPFTMVSGAVFMALFGPTDLALRFHSAFFGVVMVLFSYLWARRAFDGVTALGAAALTAVSFWPVATGRFALNPQPAPALFAGGMWFLWLALFDDRPGGTGKVPRRWWAWLLFALFLAGSLWTYEVARATTAAVVALGAFLCLFDRQRVQRKGGWFVAALALGLLLAAPHLLDPDAWQRSATLAITLRALRAGDPGPLVRTTMEALGTFTCQGDPFITYSVPGRPLYDLPVGILFWGGVALCLWRWRRPACAFTLLWMGTGLLPSMIVGAWNSTLHSMGMQTVVFVPPALLAAETARWVGRRWGRRGAYWVRLVFAGLVCFAGVSTFRDYFHRWATWPEVRAAYFHNLAAITDYLTETDHTGAVALSSPYPDLPHDPFVADLRLQRDDLDLRWFDGRWAVVLPDAPSSLFVVPPNTPLNPHLADSLDLRLVERVHLHPADVDPYFDVFACQPRVAWTRFSAAPGQAVVAGGGSLSLPANFDQVVDLVAYDVDPAPVAPGGLVTLVTAWRIGDPTGLSAPPEHYGRAVTFFVHVLDQDGIIVAQDDRLDAPAWNWHAGDGLVQAFRISVPDDVPPGAYRLAVGVYDRHRMDRLAATVEDVEVGDLLVLGELEVVGE